MKNLKILLKTDNIFVGKNGSLWYNENKSYQIKVFFMDYNEYR